MVDDVGIGGGLVDRLRELREFPVESFNGAGAAGNPRDYPNARSQAWFDFAEKLASIDLDDDEQLAADLVQPQPIERKAWTTAAVTIPGRCCERSR